MYHTAKYILYRDMKYAFIHLLITIIETAIIFIISKLIIRGVIFTSYIVWIKYAVIVFIIASIIILTINCLIYRKQTKETINIIKRNFKKKGIS